jgi:hypothetical protein
VRNNYWGYNTLTVLINCVQFAGKQEIRTCFLVSNLKPPRDRQTNSRNIIDRDTCLCFVLFRTFSQSKSFLKPMLTSIKSFLMLSLQFVKISLHNPEVLDPSFYNKFAWTNAKLIVLCSSENLELRCSVFFRK